MGESLEIARVLRDTPDLFPWVLMAVVLLIAYKQRDLISDYFRARVDYWKSMKDVNATLPEVIRNNTAAMNLCTEAFRDWKNDRGENRRMLQYHEEASAERMQHLQEVLNRVDATVTSNSRNIGLIEDRTHRSKEER